MYAHQASRQVEDLQRMVDARVDAVECISLQKDGVPRTVDYRSAELENQKASETHIR